MAWLPRDGMVGRFERFDARPGGSYWMVLTYSDASGTPGKATVDSDNVAARFADIVPGERVVRGLSAGLWTQQASRALRGAVAARASSPVLRPGIGPRVGAEPGVDGDRPADRAGDAGEDRAARRLFFLAQEDVAVIELSLGAEHADGAQAALTPPAVPSAIQCVELM